jgi:hypothetical protein
MKSDGLGRLNSKSMEQSLSAHLEWYTNNLKGKASGFFTNMNKDISIL